MRKVAFLSIVVLFMIPAALYAGEEKIAVNSESQKSRIDLKSRILTVPQDRGEALRAVTTVPAGSRRHVIIQLNRILNARERKGLADSGIKLLQYIQNKGWYASIASGLTPEASVLDEIQGSWEILSADRLHPMLQKGDFPKHAVEPDGRLILSVLVFKDVDLDLFTTKVNGIGGSVFSISRPFKILFIKLPIGALTNLAGYDEVRWIEPVAPQPRPEMDRARTYLNNEILLSGHGLDGRYATVSVHENKHAYQHLDFGDRWFQGDEPDNLNPGRHATLVAGTIAGDGSQSIGRAWKGMAPGAKLLTYAFGNDAVTAEANNYSDIAKALLEGVDVANNSWGYTCDEQPYGDYTLQASIYDQETLGQDSNGTPLGKRCSIATNISCQDDQDCPIGQTCVTYPNLVVVVFSGGNERDGSSKMTCSETTNLYCENDSDCPGDETCETHETTDCIDDLSAPYINYRTINQPKPAKNIIVVGAVDSANDAMITFSSWGPVSDGRLKPDIVAGGAHNGTIVSDVSEITNCYGDPPDFTNPQCYRTTVYNWDAENPDAWPNNYGWFAATSAAAAMVSGNAARFISNFFIVNQGYQGPKGTVAEPLPSTVKAHFIHTARDLNDNTSWYNPGPDYASGYGVLDIKAAVDQMHTGNWIEACVDQGETHAFWTSSNAVKFTLVWDDPPAAPGQECPSGICPPGTTEPPALVNDLDLIVREEASGTRYFPWTLDPANPAAPAVTTTEDHINNVEVVSAAGPMSVWVVDVKGHSVPEGPQCYSLVFSGTSYLVPVGDEDTDGVNDIFDKCPGTPEGELVNAEGCGFDTQVDSDLDGIVDGRDICPDTDASEPVDANGCARNQGGYLPQLPEGMVDLELGFGAGWTGIGCGDGLGPKRPVDFDRDGTDDTMIVFSASSGRVSTYLGYLQISNLFCGPLDRKAVIWMRFVDMLADGFDPEDEATWVYKTIPAVGLEYNAVTAETFDVHAFHGGFSMTTYQVPPLYSSSFYKVFSHTGGIREVRITSIGGTGDDQVVEKLVLMVQHPNTRYGSDITVNLVNGSVQFDEVNRPGNTFIVKTDMDIDPPTDMAICSPWPSPPFYTINTSADVSGRASSICLEYSATCDGAGLEFLHYYYYYDPLSGRVYTGWSDCTTSLDTATKTICGNFCGMSQLEINPFVLARPIADADGDGHTTVTDCNDSDNTIYPNAPEICDYKDNDCDGQTDEGLSTDADGDGHYLPGSCWGPADDCNDGDPDNYPGNPEICDGKDNDCDGQIDNGLSSDADGDGHYTFVSCLGPADDCNDGDDSIYTGATEVCDGKDNDCDTQIDDGLSTDGDGDGHYTPGSCTQPADDCDDGDADRYPGNPEICDGKDNDCDPITVDGSGESWYGDPTSCGIGICESEGQLICSGGNQVDTCTPGTPTETPESSCSDGLDNDCDGDTDCEDSDCDEDPACICTDNDGDTYAVEGGACGLIDCNDDDQTIYPGARENMDGKDNDCDGEIDEGVSTKPGLNVKVCDDTTQVCVTFPEVTEEGDTKIVVEQCTEDPWGITLAPVHPICVEIQTTAVYEGDVTVCITYDDTGMGSTEDFLSMVKCQRDCQEPDPKDCCEVVCWMDCDRYPDENTICGQTPEFSFFTIGTLTDIDSDLMPDLVDNCPELYNIWQDDTDQDGYGDVCDNCPNIYDPTNQCNLCDGDFYEDGDVDGSDLSFLIANPSQVDLDSFAANFGRNDCPIPMRQCSGAIQYDTGTPGWHWAVNQNYGIAVRFTPPTYPWTFDLAKFWPWSDSGTLDIEVHVWDDDGPGGLPGSDLITPILHHCVNTDQWENVNLPMITVDSGEFYIGWIQITADPELYYNGSDDDASSDGRSYVRYPDESWKNFSDLPEDDNMMIRQGCQTMP